MIEKSCVDCAYFEEDRERKDLKWQLCLAHGIAVMGEKFREDSTNSPIPAHWCRMNEDHCGMKAKWFKAKALA